MVEENRKSRYAKYRSTIKSMAEPSFLAPDPKESIDNRLPKADVDSLPKQATTSMSLDEIMREHDALVQDSSAQDLSEDEKTQHRWKIIGIIAISFIVLLFVVFLAALLYQLLF
ncbi:MAG: hypothetical protein LKF69_01930 [Bacilli bacterium]|jgi:hypothetical protein|nr:hypothetical protein [Bacilli bacterium]MCH4202085.1 hypothetical protein [Bacilli bacterium]MCH4235547.1 hypothetical protein [Bacilli bacterium]